MMHGFWDIVHDGQTEGWMEKVTHIIEVVGAPQLKQHIGYPNSEANTCIWIYL